MKRFIYILIGVMALMSCHKDEDDLFTQADIVLTAGDGQTVEQVQGTARITNLNSKQVTITSDFDVATIRLQLLRSSYSVDVEGLVRYRDHDGRTLTKHMRSHSDYIDLSATGYNHTELSIIFLE
jgi:hypothetical protein